MTDQRRWDHQYATDVATVLQPPKQPIPEDHYKALAVLCRICGRRCLKWSQQRKKSLEWLDKYKHVKHLQTIFQIDVTKDEKLIHPRYICPSCRSAKQDARPVIKWTPHNDGTECVTCQTVDKEGSGRRIKPAKIAAKRRKDREEAIRKNPEGPEAKRKKELAEVQQRKEAELAEAKRKKDQELQQRKEAELSEAKRKKGQELQTKEQQYAEESRKQNQQLEVAKKQRLRDIRPAILRRKQSQREKEINETKRRELQQAREKHRQEAELAQARQKEKLVAVHRTEIADAAARSKERQEAEAQRRREILEAAQAKRREQEVREAKMRKDKEMADMETHKEALKELEAKYKDILNIVNERHKQEVQTLELKHKQELALREARCQEMRTMYERRLKDVDLACGTLQMALDAGVKPTKQMSKLATALIKDMLEGSDIIELPTGGGKFALKKTLLPKVPSNQASARTLRKRNEMLLKDLCMMSSRDGKDSEAVVHQLKSLIKYQSATEIEKLYTTEELHEVLRTNSDYSEYTKKEMAKKHRRERDAAWRKAKQSAKSSTETAITSTPAVATNITSATQSHPVATSTLAPTMASQTASATTNPAVTTSFAKSQLVPNLSPSIPPVRTQVATAQDNQMLNSTSILSLSTSTVSSVAKRQLVPNLPPSMSPSIPPVSTQVATAQGNQMLNSTSILSTSTSTVSSSSATTAQASNTLDSSVTRTYTVQHPSPHCKIHSATVKSITDGWHFHTYIDTPSGTYLLQDTPPNARRSRRTPAEKPQNGVADSSNDETSAAVIALTSSMNTFVCDEVENDPDSQSIPSHTSTAFQSHSSISSSNVTQAHTVDATPLELVQPHGVPATQTNCDVSMLETHAIPPGEVMSDTHTTTPIPVQTQHSTNVPKPVQEEIVSLAQDEHTHGPNIFTPQPDVIEAEEVDSLCCLEVLE